MTDRDRLAVKICKATQKTNFACKEAKCVGKGLCAHCYVMADDLLANGIIAPPCKVGDTVWHKEEGYLLDSYKIKFIYNDMTASNISRDLLFSVEDFGKTVFLTKEEAEKALEGMNNA